MPLLRVCMPRFGHLIFDLDGTLVDSKADLAAATNYMLQALGRPLLSVAAVEQLIGLGAQALIEQALGPAHRHLAARGYALFMDYYAAHLLDHTKPYPGITGLLDAARARGVHVSVLTNKPERAAKAVLSGLPLGAYVDALVGGDTLARNKPGPDGVFVLQRLADCPSRNTLLIGDSVIDMQTGRAAGVATCGVGWGFGRPELDAPQPTLLADSVAALRRIALT